MSYVVTAPELMASAATDLSNIGSAVTSANAAAAARTTNMLAAAEDEVSTAVASLFSGHGQAFHAVSATAADFHGQFVSVLRGGAGAYLRTEVANAQSALSHQLGMTNATASGSAANGNATITSSTGATLYPGVYADGRVHVEPGATIQLGALSTISVAPDSQIWVFPSAARGGSIVVGSGSTLSAGPHSLILVHGGTINAGASLTAGPEALLFVENKGTFFAGYPVTIDHSEVRVSNNTLFNMHSHVTISQGNITGNYQVSDAITTPPNPFLPIPKRDLVVITKFPYDGSPSVRLR
jgi:hypothetical protein